MASFHSDGDLCNAALVVEPFRGGVMTIQCPACASSHTDLDIPGVEKRVSFDSIESLRKCRDCGLVFAHPMPSESALERYYRGQYAKDFKPAVWSDFTYHSYRAAKSRIQLISRYMSLTDTLRCLDIGAGNAIFGKTLQEIAPNSIYDAVEPSGALRRGWGDWVTNAYASLHDAERGNYLLIALSQVLEHVRRPLHFLQHVSEYLVRDGILFLEVPHRDDLYKYWVGPHILFWEQKSLIHVLGRAGMDVMFCQSAGMRREEAKKFLAKSSIIKKAIDPWYWAVLINKGLGIAGVKKRFNTFGKFQSDTYGEDRQWLRCIARRN